MTDTKLQDEAKGCRDKCSIDQPAAWIDPATFRKISKHPCYSEKASHKYGRIHLPVAPHCNIECNYCLREFDCVNESRPGVTSKVLTPEEALERVKEVMGRFDNIRTIGIAGPGEPLFNEQTFELIELVKDNFEGLHFCVSSNGLLLSDKVDVLSKLGIGTLTVTVNAVDPGIGEKIYTWINYDNHPYHDIQGAELLISKQIEGIKLCVDKGILVKVNTVMIPGINDYHITEIARKSKELGVFIHNIMPLIPQHNFAHLKPPTTEQCNKVRETSARYIRQMRHCRQCRADAVGLLNRDISNEIFSSSDIEAKQNTSKAA